MSLTRLLFSLRFPRFFASFMRRSGCTDQGQMRRYFILTWLLVASGSSADILDTFLWRNPLPTGNHLSSVGFVNGSIVAVGDLGTILSSPDGIVWITRNARVTNDLKGISYGNGLFVAVGSSGAILTSPDLVSWALQNSGVGVTLNAVAFAGGRFVAVGDEGVILTSSNGVNWTYQSVGGVRFLSIVFGLGRFAVVGQTSNLYTSEDGLNWTFETTQATGGVGAITFGGEMFVAAGWRPTGFGGQTPSLTILVSTNGTNWQARFPGIIGVGSLYVQGLAYGGGRFVLLQYLGGAKVHMSQNASNWTLVGTNLATPGYVGPGHGEYGLRGVTYTGDSFVAVGDYGTVAVSSSGTDWVKRSSGAVNGLKGVCYGNGRYVAVGDLGFYGLEGSSIMVSSDGVAYSQTYSGVGLSAAAFGNGGFIVLGAGGWVLQSTNAVEWTRRPSGTFSSLHDVTFGSGMFVAVGDNGTVITSPNGRVWTVRYTGTGYHLYGITYSDGQFVAVGYLGTVLLSADGIVWSVQSADTTNALYAVSHGNDQFVAVGERGTIVTSTDALSWDSRTSGVESSLYDVAFGRDRFVAVGALGSECLVSSNGVEWGKRRLPTMRTVFDAIYGVAYLNDTFVLVGARGIILQTVSDKLCLVGRSRGSSGFEVTLRGGNDGQILELQNCTSLKNENWIPLQSFTNTLPQTVLVDTNINGAANVFYRVVAP